MRKRYTRDTNPVMNAGGTITEHRNGVWWHSAPKPPRLHRCSAWTRGIFPLVPGHRDRYIERCACGAIRFSKSERWRQRNSRS